MLDGQQDLYLCPAAWNPPPAIYTPPHTEAYPKQPALEGGVSCLTNHGLWGGRRFWPPPSHMAGAPRCWPDAGHGSGCDKRLTPGGLCVLLPALRRIIPGAPSPRGARVGTAAVVSKATARSEAGFLSHQ